MKCDNCGSNTAEERKIPRTYGTGKNLFIIEHVPVVSCPTCGESYLTATILHEIERIKIHRKSFAVKRSVAVASYG